MRPLVAKVKVGDVLHGTRNLRNYLRTASILSRVENVAHGVMGHCLSSVYTPSKNDEFVVAVNAWGMFGVWCPRDNLVLLWSNPTKRQVERHGMPGRMSPADFATWFVRTSERKPNLTTWPKFAYNMWAYLHMNAIQARNVGYVYGNNRMEPFTAHRSFEQWSERNDTQSFVRAAIKRGMTRFKLGGAVSISSGGNGCGPSMSDLETMERSLRDHLSNPRLRRKVEDSGIPIKGKYI